MNFEVENSTTYNNVACSERSEPKSETAKSILENMDAILKELGTELRLIDNAIYSPSNDGCDVNEPRDECLLGMLIRQRNLAGDLLKIVVHIREGLW